MTSSFSFTDLQRDFPNLHRAWAMLQRWIDAHQAARVIVPSAVAQFIKFEEEFQDITWDDAFQLAQALDELANRHHLLRRFAVQDPSGQILFPYYESLSAIPKRVRGSQEEWLETANADIKPVFLRDK